MNGYLEAIRPKMSDEDLFSGMMQGISQIVRESIGHGDVEEIKMS